MSVWAILLRILLSVALVLNGATGAAAAVRKQMYHEDGQSHAIAAVALAVESPESSSDDMPCHQQATEADSKASLAADDSAPPGSKHPTPDCCKSSSCNCVCTHAAQAPLAFVFVHVPLVDHNLSVRPLLLGHPSPALPHLIRPPIG